MANPFTYVNGSTPITFPNGPGQSTDNLTALPNGQAMGLGAIGLAGTQYYDDEVGPIKIMLANTSSTGTISLYVIVSPDNVNWTGGISPNAHADQSTLITSYMNSGPPSPFQIGSSINVQSGVLAYEFASFSIVSILLYWPTFYTLVIANNSGANFSATAAQFVAQHNLIGFV